MEKKQTVSTAVTEDEDIVRAFDGVYASKYATSICGQLCVCNCDVTPAAISNAGIL